MIDWATVLRTNHEEHTSPHYYTGTVGNPMEHADGLKKGVNRWSQLE